MDFEWVAIALNDVSWIFLAFALGFVARLIGLPPLVGFLATGFILNHLGFSSGEMLQKLADLGITLLLFTVGLKLNLRILVRPQVWAVTSIHICLITLFFGTLLYCLSLLSISLFQQLDYLLSLLVGFALSFSSTVFAVKSLEESGEMRSLHGHLSIGILVMQDLAAVIFLAVSLGKTPTVWAMLLLLLIPARPLLLRLLKKTGHGELLILFGLALALGGAELFEMAGVKDDVGALFMGMLIAAHPKALEMAKALLGFKDLFLVGFFLTIGLSGDLSMDALLIGVLLVPLVVTKSALFFGLMTRFKVRARTSLLTTLNLSNYSEFGLIVAAIGVSNNWLDTNWLVVIAIALSLSFAVVAPLIKRDDEIYRQYRPFWMKFQSSERAVDDQVLNTDGATIAIFGMGRVGSSAYDTMVERYGATVVGVDFDADRIEIQKRAGRHVLHGDPSDADFWEQIEPNHKINLIMLALPNLRASLDALIQIRETGFTGKIAATAHYPEEISRLMEAGAGAVFNVYTEAGTGYAEHVAAEKANQTLLS